MVEAYILIQAEVGKAAQIAAEVGKIDGVAQSAAVMGPYDVVVHVTADDNDSLGNLVVAKIQAVEGVTRTLACPVVRI